MAGRKSSSPVRFQCGCGKIFPKLESWRAHRGHKEHPECLEPYELLTEQSTPSPAPESPSRAVPSPLPGAYSSQDLAHSNDDDPEEGEDQDEEAPPAGETIGPNSGRDGTKVLEPPQRKRAAKPPAEWGIPDPSKVRESLSFPVVARFMYDGYRAKYPQYQGTYAEFMQDVFMVGCRRIGMHAAVIWTDPEAPPPPAAVQPVFQGSNIDAVFEEPQSAA